MALTLKATIKYSTNGEQTVFSFPFDYLRASFVKVKFNGITAFVAGKDYRVVNRTIEFSKAPDKEGILTIYRETPTDRLVSFTEGSVLMATDLTVNQIQTIHILEETVDNVYQSAMSLNSADNWDAQNKRIVNVATAIEPQDAVSYEFLKQYASFGSTGLDPEDLKKLLSGVTEVQESVQILEKAIANVQASIPTKTSQLENDDFVVKDESYVHTDNNLTDERRQMIDAMKEITAINFTANSPFWTGDTLTLALKADQYFIALYKATASGAVLDTTTPCKQEGTSVIVSASAPFAGYVLVTGATAYGDLNELLGLILNEEVPTVYTLEDIMGEAYSAPTYPNEDQLANAVTALQTCANTLRTDCANILVECKQVLAQCKNYYDSMKVSDV